MHVPSCPPSTSAESRGTAQAQGPTQRISRRQGRRMERQRVEDLAAWDGSAREARRRIGGASTPMPTPVSSENGVEAELGAFPAPFAAFLKREGVDPGVFDAVLPRYVRLGPSAGLGGAGGDEGMAVAEELGTTAAAVTPVRWLPPHYRFYAVEGEGVGIAHTPAYRAGDLYGIDAASGAAVAALGVAVHEHVLEICCAPGAKLMLLSDLMKAERQRLEREQLGRSGLSAEEGEVGGAARREVTVGSVTGVDVSRNRLGATRKLLQKYKAQRARLYLADGRTFDVAPPGARGAAGEVEWREAQARGLPNRAWFWSSRDLPNDLPAAAAALYAGTGKAASGTYDAVLVDAECTHDGSIKHVSRFSDPEVAQSLARRVLDPERMEALPALQRELLINGLRLAKPGGRVVYCTCSFARSQNEDVVAWALEKLGPRVELEAVAEAANWPCTIGGTTTDGRRLAHAIRFDPSRSNTSSLFIARLRLKA